jgi:dephospho-CoA kinase
MKIVLTGGIACGKSLLSKFLNELGVETLDADDVVHELLPDPEERRRIAAEVFADPEKLRALEAKIHPLVKEKIDAWLDRTNGTTETAETSGTGTCPVSPGGLVSPACPVRVAIIPLLFEAHWEKNFDIICCVASTRENQVKRMVATRGMTHAEAEARLAAQLPVEEKARRSHYVIHNDGTADELRAEARKFVDWLSTTQPPNHPTA